MRRIDQSLRIRERELNEQRTRFALRYGRVFFAARERLGLTATETLLMDVIATLAKKTGWCFASRKYVARMLGVSPRSVRRMLARLQTLDLVETHPKRRRLIRPTARWYKVQDTPGAAA